MKHAILAEDNQCDITEGVQVAYDTCLASMDWGSGFLDNDEMAAIIQLGIYMGFKLPTLSDDGPEVSVAQAFPDHYERTLAFEYRDGSRRYHWTEKKDP